MLSCAKRIAKTTVIACLAYMSITFGVNAQQDMKIDQFNEVIKQVEELKKTDLVQALQKLIVFDDILHEADLAMYQAKEQGRNTFVCYQNIAVAKEKRGN